MCLENQSRFSNRRPAPVRALLPDRVLQSPKHSAKVALKALQKVLSQNRTPDEYVLLVAKTVGQSLEDPRLRKKSLLVPTQAPILLVALCSECDREHTRVPQVLRESEHSSCDQEHQTTPPQCHWDHDQQ